MKAIHIALGFMFLVISIAVFFGVEVNQFGVGMAYFTGATLFFGRALESDRR